VEAAPCSGQGQSELRLTAVSKPGGGPDPCLDDFRLQPRSRLVWRRVIEPIPIAPRTVSVTVTPETAQEWLRRKVSPTEPILPALVSMPN
jgi:hypothetical protein